MKRPIETMLIEDNAGDAFLISELLGEVGIQVNITIAVDGQMALDMLNKVDGYKSVPTPDLVVLDLNLPKVHGFEVLRYMKGSPSLRLLPVVVMTGSLNRDDETKARSLGVTDYRVKPASTEDFDSTVRWLRKNLASLPAGK